MKELGFNEHCVGKFFYNHFEIGGIWTNDDFKEDPDIFISAPLKQQVFKWFRDTRNLIGLIVEGGYDSGKNKFRYVIWRGSFDYWIDTYRDNYEEAENACIDKLIELTQIK